MIPPYQLVWWNFLHKIFRGLEHPDFSSDKENFYGWLMQFAAITSSILFGLIHLNFLQFFFARFMGVVCCYIYEATGKIRYSMLLHLLNNSVLVLFSILPVTNEFSAIIQIALGVVSLVAVIAYLVYRKKKQSALKTDITKETKKNCLYFFTSVPMIVFVLACLGVCAYMSFA